MLPGGPCLNRVMFTCGKVEELVELDVFFDKSVLPVVILFIGVRHLSHHVALDLLFVVPASERSVKAFFDISANPLASDEPVPCLTDWIVLADDVEDALGVDCALSLAWWFCLRLRLQEDGLLYNRIAEVFLQ